MIRCAVCRRRLLIVGLTNASGQPVGPVCANKGSGGQMALGLGVRRERERQPAIKRQSRLRAVDNLDLFEVVEA